MAGHGAIERQEILQGMIGRVMPAHGGAHASGRWTGSSQTDELLRRADGLSARGARLLSPSAQRDASAAKLAAALGGGGGGGGGPGGCMRPPSARSPSRSPSALAALPPAQLGFGWSSRPALARVDEYDPEDPMAA